MYTNGHENYWYKGWMKRTHEWKDIQGVFGDQMTVYRWWNRTENRQRSSATASAAEKRS